MVAVVRDYLDPEQIGQIIEVVVTNGNKPQITAVGRMLFYAEGEEVVVIQFEGGADCVLRFPKFEELTVRYDVEVA